MCERLAGRSRSWPPTTSRSPASPKVQTTRQTLVDVISTGYFDALGVRPVHGRDFSREEERPGTPARPVIVSYKHWERLGLDPNILTRTIRINGQDYGIVGVAPPNFGGTTAIIATEFWLPLGVHDFIESDFDARDQFPLSDRRNHSLIVVGRLQPGVSLDQADQQLKVIAAAHEKAFPVENKDRDLLVRPLGRLSISTSPQDDTQLWVPVTMLQGLAAAVLLTSCLNLANMMLAFGSTRQKEIAIRLAIGGGRARIVRQLLVQGLLLSLAGGALGLIVSSWAANLLVSRDLDHPADVDPARRHRRRARGIGHVCVLHARDGGIRFMARAAIVATRLALVAQRSGWRN